MFDQVTSSGVPDSGWRDTEFAAAYIGKTKRWLLEYIRNHPGEIKFARLGQTKYFRIEDLDEFLASRVQS